MISFLILAALLNAQTSPTPIKVITASGEKSTVEKKNPQVVAKEIPLRKAIIQASETKNVRSPSLKPASSSVPVITLAKARLLAEKGNLDIRLLALKIRELEIEKNIAKYKMYPLVKVESSAILWNDRLAMSISLPQEFKDMLAAINPTLNADIPPMLIRKQFTWQTSVTVAQPITPLLTLSHVHKMKSWEIQAEKANIKLEKRKVLENVDTAYYNCLRAEKYLAVILEAQKTLDGQKKRVEDLIEAKLANTSDLSKITSALADLRAQKIKALASIILSKQYLAYLLGMDPEKPLATAGASMPGGIIPVYKVCLAKAKKTRPEFKLIDMNNEQLESAVKALEYDRIPRLSIVAQYKNSFGFGELEPENQFFIGALFSWEFQWKNKWRERDKLMVKKRTLEIMREKIRRGLMLEISQNSQGIKTSKALVDAQRQALKTAMDNFEKTEKLLESKYSTVYDILTARLEVTKASINLVNAEFDYWLSIEKYRRSCGY
ncbi:TolC family protein [Myxococcota bacterium]|nr:TolC family protein [Myxococcota bacterium]MBU1382432.1 TolC family protein [Myxococcota bacterium]MBU1497548.1 TolC family protein [Myxococcota bacterium]